MGWRCEIHSVTSRALALPKVAIGFISKAWLRYLTRQAAKKVCC